MMPISLFLLATIIKGPADVASLAAASDVVARARVVKSESHWASKGGQIFTTVTLRSIESWKGAAEPEFQVLVEGGSVGEFDQTVQGVARFSPGEEVVLFLHRRTNGVYSVSSMSLGKFAVSPKGRAVRDRSALECVGCAPGERDEFSLDELRRTVRR